MTDKEKDHKLMKKYGILLICWILFVIAATCVLISILTN
jgi:hypothetical protein